MSARLNETIADLTSTNASLATSIATTTRQIANLNSASSSPDALTHSLPVPGSEHQQLTEALQAARASGEVVWSLERCQRKLEEAIAADREEV